VACGRMAAAASIAAVVLLAASACATTEQMNATPQSSASTATASASLKAAQAKAIARLQEWLHAPQPGTLTYNTVQVTGGGTVNVMSILSGTFDPNLGRAQLSGAVQTLGSGSTTQDPSAAVEDDETAYTTIPQPLQTGDLLGKQWGSASVHATWAKDAVHSGWWTVLDAVRHVTADGATTLDGITVDVYSATLDLAQVKGIPKQLLDSDPVKKAGTTQVEVDVYIELGTGTLERVTYKLGLPVQIDAAATASSSAGYQIDLSGFDQSTPTLAPSPTSSATIPPDPGVVAKDQGDEDLAALLPF